MIGDTLGAADKVGSQVKITGELSSLTELEKQALKAALIIFIFFLLLL